MKALAVCAMPMPMRDFFGDALFQPLDGFEGNPFENHAMYHTRF
jgi:hypothetical protein